MTNQNTIIDQINQVKATMQKYIELGKIEQDPREFRYIMENIEELNYELEDLYKINHC